MEIQEEQLISQLTDGAEQAYKYIYDHYYVSLCHLANKYLQDGSQAEMIVGDAIFHLWEIREKVQIKTSLLGYLINSVRNRSLNYLALARVRCEVPMSRLVTASGFEQAGHATSKDHALESMYQKELNQELEKALGSLSTECKTVFLKSRLEEKKYEEISQELGISVNTVKYHIKNALRLLRERVHQYPAIFVLLFLFFENDYPLF